MNQTIKLDTRKREGKYGEARISPLRRGERNNVVLSVAVRRDRRPYDLAGRTAHLVWKAADDKLVGPVPMEVTDTAAGTVRCTLPEACYAAVGTAHAYIEIRNGAELVDTTDEMLVKVLDCIDADAEQAEEYKPLIAEVREATDAAIKAAAKAVTDTQAAIAEVKATEAKLYPAAENILVGSDSGTVAHVEDAFAGASLREITIEGACKQDGIPSPDAPKPIAVIENPVLWVTGRNVFRLKPNLAPYSSNGISFTPLKDGGIRVVGTATDTTYYQLDFGPGYYFSIKPFIGQRLFRENISGFSIGYARIDGSNETLKTDESVPPDAVWWRSFLVERPSGQAVDKLVYPNACIDKLHPYAPNTSQQLAFTLPAEHPYLAKLPDGTADEIVVDQEGNVELVARVLRIKVPESGITWNIQEQSGGFSLGYSGAVPGIKDIRKNLSAKALINDRFESRENWENNPCFGVSGTLWVVPKTNQGAITSEDVAAVANGMVFYAPLATSVTYPLGKIEIPKTQDSIINVWTDAEVAPNTGIEYVRDVNIVVANLEAAIASITEG